ncbi:MAG: NAD-dependent epimerase/dehydratase family protein, partial [Anaerolineales bacterium]
MYLVTGATGHIGNVLVRKLVAAGEQVRALILPGEDTTPIEGLPVEKIAGDVLDTSTLSAAFRGVRGVFHLAGVISILPGNHPQVWAVNVEGTKNVLKAAVQCGIERLVYTSSIHAIQRVESGVIDESLPYDPHNPYGAYDRSKAAATLEVQQAAQAGLNAVIACPTGVIGPFDYRRSLMGAIIRAAAHQQPTLYVDGAYDFVDVRDVADGLIGAARRGRPGESYILSGQKISVRYLLETVREITGRGFFQLKVPFTVAKLVSFFMPHYYRLVRSSPRFTPYALRRAAVAFGAECSSSSSH